MLLLACVSRAADIDGAPGLRSTGFVIDRLFPDVPVVDAPSDRVGFEITPPPITPPFVPAELQYVIPPQVGDNTTNGFILKVDFVTNVDALVAHWMPADLVDKKVAVTNGATPGYLGQSSSDGVLRTDDTIDYTVVYGEAVQLSVDGGGVWTNIVENGFYGYTTNAMLEPGTCHGQVMWWDDNASAWINTSCPTSPAVLVFDKVENANGTVRWETIDTLYKGIFRDTNSNATADWPRFHAE